MADFVHIERPTNEDPLADLVKGALQDPAKPDLSYLGLHPFVKHTVLDKIYGSIIGSALGDTVGLYTEFLPKSACASIYKQRKFSLVEPVTEWYPDSHRSKFEMFTWENPQHYSLLGI